MALLPFYTAPWCFQGRRAASCWDSTLSRGYSCPGLQPQHATTPGSAPKHSALCTGQPALSPDDPAGDPPPSRLRCSTEPGPSAHYASHNLTASYSNHQQQLRRKDCYSQVSCGEDQKGGGECCLSVRSLSPSGLILAIISRPWRLGQGGKRAASPLPLVFLGKGTSHKC